MLRPHTAIICLLLAGCLPVPTAAQEADDQRLRGLQSDVQRLQREIRSLQSEVSRLRRHQPRTTPVRDDPAIGATLLLCGAFCALWAQNTGRSPWLWFFAGLLFNVITIFVLLAKNAEDHHKKAAVDDTD